MSGQAGVSPGARGAARAASGQVQPYAVDPAELAAVGRVLQAGAEILTGARTQLGHVRAGAAQWAVDGDLPLGLARLLDTLDWATDQARYAAGALAERLEGAAVGYRAADDAATFDPPGGVAASGSGR